MRIVLDTNVYISAFLWGGKPREVLERAIEGKDELFLSRFIRDEIIEVARRPRLDVDEAVVGHFLRELDDIATAVVVTGRIENLCRDADDNPIVECAVAAKADFLVTGDADLLELGTYRGIRILRPAEYLAIAAGRTQ